MKKILLILIIIFLYSMMIYEKTAITEVGKIDLNLKENETTLTILNSSNSKSILINDKNLLIITYIDENEISEILNNFNIKILSNLISLEQITTNINSYNRYLLNENIEIDDIKIEKEENIIKIKQEDNLFCIYENGSNKNLNNCDFIWFIEIDDIDFDDDTKVVFYDNAINQKKIEKFYDKWVDSYTLNNESYYSLRINEENYDIIDISVTK